MEHSNNDLENNNKNEYKPFIDFVINNIFEITLFLVLIGLIIYELISNNSNNYSIKTNYTQKGGGLLGLGNVGRLVSSNLKGGISPLTEKFSNLSENYGSMTNVGSTLKNAIFYILQLGIIILVFLPCLSLLAIIVLCYYFVRPKIKYLKSL